MKILLNQIEPGRTILTRGPKHFRFGHRPDFKNIKLQNNVFNQIFILNIELFLSIHTTLKLRKKLPLQAYASSSSDDKNSENLLTTCSSNIVLTFPDLFSSNVFSLATVYRVTIQKIYNLHIITKKKRSEKKNKSKHIEILVNEKKRIN